MITRAGLFNSIRAIIYKISLLLIKSYCNSIWWSKELYIAQSTPGTAPGNNLSDIPLNDWVSSAINVLTPNWSIYKYTAKMQNLSL